MKEQLAVKIKELEEKISVLNNELRSAKQQFAELSTEFKPGDRVTYEGAKKEWEVRAIKPSAYSGEARIFGAKIKKDGTPGAVLSEIWVPYKKNLVLVNNYSENQPNPPKPASS